jgi:hypothetical protein
LTTLAIMAEVQWVASAGGSVWVSLTTRWDCQECCV